MDPNLKYTTRPLRNKSKESLTSNILEASRQSFERAKSLLRNFSSERNIQATSSDTVDVFRLKERINQEFDRFGSDIHIMLRNRLSYYNEQDFNSSIYELQNRIGCIVQTMCNNKYKTVNPDLSLNEFHVLEQKRFDHIEESIIKFQRLNSARIK